MERRTKRDVTLGIRNDQTADNTAASTSNSNSSSSMASCATATTYFTASSAGAEADGPARRAPGGGAIGGGNAMPPPVIFEDGMGTRLIQYMHLDAQRPLRRLGKGGHGEVYLAHSTVHGAMAVKVVDRAHRGFADLAMREARTMEQLRDCPGLMRAIAVANVVLLAMPLMSEDLLSYCRRFGNERARFAAAYAADVGAADVGAAHVVHHSSSAASEHQILMVAACMGLALGGMHERGWGHHDVKPANILLDARGTPRLSDFGCAARVGPKGESFSSSTTLWYRTPESLAYAGSVDDVDDPSEPLSDKLCQEVGKIDEEGRRHAAAAYNTAHEREAACGMLAMELKDRNLPLDNAFYGDAWALGMCLLEMVQGGPGDPPKWQSLAADCLGWFGVGCDFTILLREHLAAQGASQRVADLVTALLHPLPWLRLTTLDALQRHPSMAGVDWGAIAARMG